MTYPKSLSGNLNAGSFIHTRPELDPPGLWEMGFPGAGTTISPWGEEENKAAAEWTL